MIKPINGMTHLAMNTITMFANIDGKILVKSFNFKKMCYKEGFRALQAGFAVKLDKLETVKEAERILNGQET